MIHFTYDYIRDQLEAVLACGYRPVTCEDYSRNKATLATSDKVWVNRVDVDFSLAKADALRSVFASLDIKATFFVRLHAPEYNPFSFEGYRVLKALVADGHEIGYHSEIVDQAAIWQEDATDCLERDLAVMTTLLGKPVSGVASHGGMTGLNNLDFWKDHRPSEFDLLYEAYDTEPTFNLFQESFYVSDSEWTRWKCYDRGVLVPDDRRSLAEHAAAGHRLLYTLIHPDTYFARHFYESAG